jgi:hypothetical protein
MRSLAEMFRLILVLLAASTSRAALVRPVEAALPAVRPLGLPAPALSLAVAAPTPVAAPVMAELAQIVSALSATANKSAELAAAERLKGFWNGEPHLEPPPVDAGPPVSEVVDRLVYRGSGTSRAFVGKIKSHLREKIPAAILRDMLADGYRIEVAHRPRKGRRKLHHDYDYSGGFNSYGPRGRYIVISQEIRDLVDQKWRANEVWVNGIDHEIGHAVGYVLGEREAARRLVEHAPVAGQTLWFALKGISEHIDFRNAWQADYEAIPAHLKSPLLPDLRPNTFYYFLRPDKYERKAGQKKSELETGSLAPERDGWFQRARQETFAEGFDVLLRGSASTFNYENFVRYFPRSLADLRARIERAYGLVLLPN